MCAEESIMGVIKKLDETRSVSVGPLEEIDYWRYRSKTLTSVNESLLTKQAKEIIDIWDAANPEIPYKRPSKIKALMAEAKDNARYVTLPSLVCI